MSNLILIILLILILVNNTCLYENMSSTKIQNPPDDTCDKYTTGDSTECTMCTDTKINYSKKCTNEQTFTNCKDDIEKIFDKVNECKMCLYCNFKKANDKLKPT